MFWLIIIIILALMIPLVAVVLDSHLGRALAGRLGQEVALGSGDEGVGKRVAQLESEIERLNAEVVRLDEETTFLHRLLEAKPERGALPPGDKES